MRAQLNPSVQIIGMFVCSLIAMLNITQAQTKPHTYEVKAHRNLRYAEKPDGVYVADTSSDRLLDLYLPVDDGGAKRPVILFIHGGGFGGGDKSGLETFWRDLASNGFAVISAN